MKRVVSLFVLAGFVVGCSPVSPVLHTTLSSQGQYPLPLVLNDGTGLVTAIAPATSIGFDTSSPDTSLTVHADPAHPDSFIADWLGGACVRDAALTFTRSGTGYVLNLIVHAESGGCISIGVFRAVRVSTSVAIPVDTISASGSEP